MFKSLDFFQKLSVDNVSKPTLLGSILSMTAISLMFYLIIKEIFSYYSITLKEDSILYHDPDQTSKIPVNLSFHFFSTTCDILSVDQEDLIGNHRIDIGDTIAKTRIDNTGNTINTGKSKVNPLNPTLTVERLEQGEGCLVNGHVLINKVPGDIHISYHNYREAFESIKYQHRSTFKKLRLNHHVSLLNFGDMKSNEIIKNKFGIESFSFNRKYINLPNFKADTNKTYYDYFIKLIPHLFVDEYTNEQFLAYEYSLNFRSRVFDKESDDMPIVMINYDISPVTMQITLKQKLLSHTLTHICAIIGGIFVIFSIFNRIILSVSDSL